MISIIVPIYNSEKHLPQCIESIKNQCYSDFELILVNDGSTDSSGCICDSYAKNDDRIKVFHKQNGGVSSARNLGLKNSVGDFVTFVDSDDYLENNFLKQILDDYINNDVELVYQNVLKFSKSERSKLYSFDSQKLDIQSFFKNHLVSSYGYVHSKLFSADIIKNNNLVFDEKISFGEDCIFISDYLFYCNHVLLSVTTNYNYRVSPESLITKLYSFEKEMYIFSKLCENLLKLFDKQKLNSKNDLFYKESQYYLYRILKSNSRIANKRERVQNLKNLYHNFEHNIEFIYRKAKRIGFLLLFFFKLRNFNIVDSIYQNLVFKKK